jgi:hypothetical protein
MRTTTTIDDIANAPTRPLTTIPLTRQAHIRATLGGNRIIRDYYKTQYLTGERVTKVLPRRKSSLWRSIIDLFTNHQTQRRQHGQKRHN